MMQLMLASKAASQRTKLPCQVDIDGMANSVNSDQTAFRGNLHCDCTVRSGMSVQKVRINMINVMYYP